MATDDEAILRDCVEAVVSGPFVPEWEFHTLFGLSRVEASAILEDWESGPMGGRKAVLIHNAVNTLVRYPHGEEANWDEWISVAPDDVERVYRKWRQADQDR